MGAAAFRCRHSSTAPPNRPPGLCKLSSNWPPHTKCRALCVGLAVAGEAGPKPRFAANHRFCPLTVRCGAVWRCMDSLQPRKCDRGLARGFSWCLPPGALAITMQHHNTLLSIGSFGITSREAGGAPWRHQPWCTTHLWCARPVQHPSELPRGHPEEQQQRSGASGPAAAGMQCLAVGWRRLPPPPAATAATCAISTNASDASDLASAAAQESKNILEGFFIGRALAETVNERLGAALGDALAEFGKWDAETRQAIR